MQSCFRFSAASLAAFAAICVFGGSALAQSPTASRIRPANRVRTTVDDRARVMRPGNRHPFARPENDAGIVPPDTRMDRMILVLEPDQAQQSALDTLLAAQQDPESPQYHQWLTPDEFGNAFGVSQDDSDKVVAWLQEHGLEVDSVSASRREIIFSGTAEQVSAAFHTEIHTYYVNGETHYANASDPEIPLALAPVVSGVLSLHDFHGKTLHRGAQPLYTSGSSHYLAPADFAAIYNAGTAYSSGIDGTGQSIAVVGRTNINLTDVQMFRSTFGLPGKQPVVVMNGPDPGIVSRDEEIEAALDVEWAGAVAKNATIQFVISRSTYTSDGVALSAQYIVNKNLAPVMTVSFGLCESMIGSSGNTFWNNVWQQAAAQGITVLVASGDSGVAGCDGASAASATRAAGVNGICSSPYSTCVGGTQFADTVTPSAYWTSSNATGYRSALGYIPEVVWNESGAVAGGGGLWASGGGPSMLYSKPAWQTGTGVPSDGRRYVPDVSLSGASHVGYLVRVEGQFYIVGGTSAASPAFAGLMGMVAQKNGGRQGNANPVLYSLASKQATGGAAVFHDITSGSNTVPGMSGYSAGAGYDAATGLGSVEANTLVMRWTDGIIQTPSLRLSTSPTASTVTVGSSSQVTVQTTVAGGFNAPVVLSTGTLPVGLTASFTATSLSAPGGGSVTLTLTAAAQMTPGTYSITISAAGGSLNQSVSLPVTVSPVCSYALNPLSASVAATGSSYSFALTVANGCSWTASSPQSWITITGGSSGNGNGTVTYSVATNIATSARSGSITAGGIAFGITQAGASTGAPVYTATPSTGSVSASGGSGSFVVSVTPSTTNWTASSNVSWLTITSGGTGPGSKTVTWAAAANPGPSRNGTITVGTTSYFLTQAGSACGYAVSVSALSKAINGYGGTVTVTAGAGCAWKATSNASWLTITSGSSGSGNGQVRFLAAFNTTKNNRSAVLSVAGYNITITETASMTAVKVEELPTDDL